MLCKLFNTDKPGFYQGKHYTEHVERVRDLKRRDKLAEVERLLLALIAAVEAEDAVQHGGKAPWYTEQLAIVYRTQRRYADEVAILERFNRGEKHPAFADRITKTKALAIKATAD